MPAVAERRRTQSIFAEQATIQFALAHIFILGRPLMIADQLEPAPPPSGPMQLVRAGR